LRLSQQISALTDGAFDVTYASVGYLYSYPDQQRPNEKQIESLLDAVDYQHITLDTDNLHVSFKHPNVKIDLGGIAKGFAVDNSINLLKKLGIANALVTAGGDTRLLGDRLGKPWVVGIRDPRDKEKNAVLMPLADSAMSTSGDYERYFEEDGIRYHHIITPQTGKSARQVQSVSIIGPLSVYNDALSTAVFVLGLERGIGLINGLPEFEAIVMDNNRRLHYSSGLGQ
jgi:thiamine biosynthesis lipoprotein